MFKFENDGELIFEKIIPRMGWFHVIFMVKTIKTCKNTDTGQFFLVIWSRKGKKYKEETLTYFQPMFYFFSPWKPFQGV